MADSIRLLENVFVTEGVPDETFVSPSNFNEIMVDMRHPGKPVVIEGASGTGKTCTAKKILERLGKGKDWLYLSGRKTDDLIIIGELAENPSPGVFILDDFHRIPPQYQNKLSDIAKIAADESNPKNNPKLILIGINQVGESLIYFSPDIAKRCGIHKISSARLQQTKMLIHNGCEALNISIGNIDNFHKESGGDYWLTQTLCRTLCAIEGITETQMEKKEIVPNFPQIRHSIVEHLKSSYYEPIKEFCRGRRFRPSNDPYFRILQFIATKNDSSSVDLVELANANPEIAGSINNVKDGRLSILLSEKSKAGQYFYYNKQTARFSVEDPALFYLLKNMDWTQVRRDCGFREKEMINSAQYDIAISFAGENREIARQIANRLIDLDVMVYFDENHETALLGKKLNQEFKEIFLTKSRFVLCILDKYHLKKMWPTFERDIFVSRVDRGQVIPIFLDDTKFPGIPDDIYGIKLEIDLSNDNWRNVLDDKVILRLIDKIG